jgi:very-long-chain (3R)-3-hydroxyacyl-CoA dehydratase
MIKTAYLLAYNVGLMLGWGVILVRILQHLAQGKSHQTVYPLVRELLIVCQTAALVEVLHAVFKVVRSPVGTTAIQVASRIVVLYGALELGSSQVTTSHWAAQMIVAWSIAEIIRYSYYAVALVVDKEKIPTLLTIIRYSGFLVLYPMGISGEIGCLYNALPFVAAKKPYTVEMPNWYNFSFDYYTFVWFLLLVCYPYGSYVMYTYMLSQRRKVLSGGKSSKADGADKKKK